MFERWVEEGLLDLLEKEGVGCIPFSPLAQGLLTNKYLQGIPADSRAAKPHGHLRKEEVTDKRINQIQQLHQLAQHREQSLAQMALAWLLKDERVTSVLIGASSTAQLADSLLSLSNTHFNTDELAQIEAVLQE
jgi:L-glyceraldehyde 3-phosphate reductase